MNRIFHSIFIVSITLSLLAGCKREAPDYTYDFLSVYWVDEGLDADRDGFITSRALQCEAMLYEEVIRDVELKIYYRSPGTGDFIYYKSSFKTEFQGGESSVFMITIGNPEELVHDTYTFLVELCETGNTRVEASDTIANVKFERLINDQIFDLTASWSDIKDADADGFAQYATLNLDVDVKDAFPKTIRAEVYCRLMDSDQDYESIYTGDGYSIWGNFPDNHPVPVNVFPDTLSHGLYEFRVIIYDENAFNPVLIYDGDMAEELKNIPFETEMQDGFIYSLNTDNIAWTQVVDSDGDGYAQSKILLVDIDIDKEESVSVFLKILRKLSPDSLFDVLDSTEVFTITGKSPNDQIQLPVSAFNVTDSVKMTHGEYDFMLTLVELIPGFEPDLRFSVDSVNGQILQRQKFELDTEDK